MIEIPVNALDPNHLYVFRSGEYGKYYSYWYLDHAGNYYKYSNAPEGHPEHDPFGGDPILDPEQPFLHNAPEFFTPEGLKRNMAPPDGVAVLDNPNYDRSKLETSWYEYYLAEDGNLRFLYLDRDVKEIPDLYVQHQIRVVDAGLNRLRRFAAEAFQRENPRDKTLGCILQLVDQGWYQPEELVNATVADIDFIDEAVYLLRRKIRVDVHLFDYLTSLVAGRALQEPLFTQSTLHGAEMPIGLQTIGATFAYLRVSSVFLLYWHATHIFSKIINKLHTLRVPAAEVEDRAFQELANTFNASNDVSYLVDFQVSATLLQKYLAQDPAMEQVSAPEQTQKSFNISSSDSYGVAEVFSDLIERRGDELAFSHWLHAQPLHSEYEGSTVEEDEQLRMAAAEEEMSAQEEQAQLMNQQHINDQDGDGQPDNVIDETGQTFEDVPQGGV